MNTETQDRPPAKRIGSIPMSLAVAYSSLLDGDAKNSAELLRQVASQPTMNVDVAGSPCVLVPAEALAKVIGFVLAATPVDGGDPESGDAQAERLSALPAAPVATIHRGPSAPDGPMHSRLVRWEPGIADLPPGEHTLTLAPKVAV